MCAKDAYILQDKYLHLAFPWELECDVDVCSVFAAAEVRVVAPVQSLQALVFQAQESYAE